MFDPSGDPLGGMMGMMRYSNFVSEEWAHVLTWDLLVGRLIWMDGLNRGVFTSHSVLLTNLIGPPGFLLHILTCLVFQKGLPPPELLSSAPQDSNINNTLATNTKAATAAPFKADQLVSSVFPNLLSSSPAERQLLLDACDVDVVWEDTNDSQPSITGKQAVETMLQRRSRSFPTNARLVIDKLADGVTSCGFTWYLEQDGVSGIGLRGTIYVELNPTNNKIAFVREVCEPLFKPGSALVQLLKAAVSEAVKKDPTLAIKPSRTMSLNPKKGASALVKYLWVDNNGGDKQLTLAKFDKDIIYQDFNFEKPFVGLEAVSGFIDEFDMYVDI